MGRGGCAPLADGSRAARATIASGALAFRHDGLGAGLSPISA